VRSDVDQERSKCSIPRGDACVDNVELDAERSARIEVERRGRGIAAKISRERGEDIERIGCGESLCERSKSLHAPTVGVSCATSATTRLRVCSFQLESGSPRVIARDCTARSFLFMRMLTGVLIFALTMGANAIAQNQSGGTISGVVRDVGGNPIGDAEVYAFPEKNRAKTDSAGKFSIPGLPSGFYHIRVRRIGFRPIEVTTDLNESGHVDLKIELAARPALLDSVIVQADGKCATISFTGFNCRKQRGKGLYLTDDDLADKGAIDLGEVFRDVPGFRLENRQTRYGSRPIPFSTRGGCINALINGRPLSLSNPLPLYATELIAVEIYTLPSSVPAEYQRYVWDPTIRQTSPIVGRDRNDQACSLVVYWTSFH
jgi:hypothetical protein